MCANVRKMPQIENIAKNLDWHPSTKIISLPHAKRMKTCLILRLDLLNRGKKKWQVVK